MTPPGTDNGPYAAAPAYLSTVVWCLISLYLFVDMLSGALMGGVSETAPLSQAWKALIVLAIMLWFSAVSIRAALFALGLFAFLLSGPWLRFLASGDTRAFRPDLLAGIKAVAPALIFAFCCVQRIFEPNMIARWLPRSLWLGSAAILLNMCFGLFGFGYTSYGSTETGGIGVTGFFYAGNELAATFVVLSGFVLMKIWNGRRWLYAPAALLIVAMALAVATKTAMFAAVVLAFGIPLVYRRGRLLRLTWGGALAMVLACTVLAFAIIQIRFLLELSGVGSRIARLFAEGGWFSVLFSGRDYYAEAGTLALTTYGSLFDVVFGVGQQTVDRWAGKAATETDLLDLYLWFGVPGLIYAILLYLAFLYVSTRAFMDRSNAAGPAVLLTNLLLIAASVVSGHVVVSAIVGIVWAAFTATALTPLGVPKPRSVSFQK